MKVLNINQSTCDKPNIQLTVRRVESSVWKDLQFDKHHYLSADLNKSCKCLLFEWDNTPIAFVGILNTPRKGCRFGHAISRCVILPDYQGLGLSSKIIDFCGGILKSLGDEYYCYLKTIHEKMGGYLTRSEKWQPTSYNGKQRGSEVKVFEGKKYKNRLERISYCFKYSGEAIYGYEELLKPVKELRDKKYQLTLEL